MTLMQPLRSLEAALLNLHQPRVTLRSASRTLQAASLTLQAPPLTLQAPPLTLQAPPLTLQAPSLTLQAPLLTLQTPSLTLQAPSLTLQVASLTLQVPSLTLQVASLTLQVPPLKLQAGSLKLHTSCLKRETSCLKLHTGSLELQERRLKLEEDRPSRRPPGCNLKLHNDLQRVGRSYLAPGRLARASHRRLRSDAESLRCVADDYAENRTGQHDLPVVVVSFGVGHQGDQQCEQRTHRQTEQNSERQGVDGMLFGVAWNDVSTLVAVPALVTGLAVLACLVPAARATRVDTIEVLRAE
jgi:hypothetical protein